MANSFYDRSGPSSSVYFTGSNALSWVQPVAFQELRNFAGHRIFTNVTGVRFAAFTMYFNTVPAAASIIGVQWSTDNITFRNLDVGTGASATVGGCIISGPYAVGWATPTVIAVNPAFTGFVWLRVVGSGGDGVTTPIFNNVHAALSYFPS